MAGVEPRQPEAAVVSPDEVAIAALFLARRFAAGATMWCVSAQWPDHGNHVAVEFVHPVIVGKRALPAVCLEGSDVTGALRLLSRPGDVLLALSTSDDPTTTDLLRRADAWGMVRVWLGAGPRPDSTEAEHVVWAESTEPGRTARSGDVMLLYHLLWELTHVVFEHPGLLTEPPCTDGACITCSDEAEVAEVRAVRDAGTAEVLVHGRPRSVDVTLVEAVVPGDLLLVHAGVAITALEVTRP